MKECKNCKKEYSESNHEEETDLGICLDCKHDLEEFANKHGEVFEYSAQLSINLCNVIIPKLKQIGMGKVNFKHEINGVEAGVIITLMQELEGNERVIDFPKHVEEEETNELNDPRKAERLYEAASFYMNIATANNHDSFTIVLGDIVIKGQKTTKELLETLNNQ